MRTRLARMLLCGVGVAVAPALVVVVFTWMWSGRPIGWVALIGRGELLPATAVLAAQAVLDGNRLRQRDAIWHIAVGIGWLMVALCCVLYVVPYSAPVSAGPRIAIGSLVVLVGTVVAATIVIWKEPP